MSTTARRVNLLAVIVPFLAFLVALVLLWNRAVGPRDLAILAAMYALSGLGVTVGFHRLLTHRSFETRRPLKYVVAVLAIPFVLGYLLGGTLPAALTALLWGGLVRVFLLHHVTWSINSVCHFFGRRRFATEDHSTNVFWLALPSFGESWHHNHHAFPRAAQHGLRRWELDPSGALIRVLERLGLAGNVVRITPERQRERESQVTVRASDPLAAAPR